MQFSALQSLLQKRGFRLKCYAARPFRDGAAEGASEADISSRMPRRTESFWFREFRMSIRTERFLRLRK